MLRKKARSKTKEIVLDSSRIVYEIKTSARAKRLRLSICFDGTVKVTRPVFVSDKTVDKFVQSKIGWIDKKIKFIRENKNNFPKRSRQDYLKKKEEALFLVRQKIEELNKVYSFDFNKVTIKNQKTRWGSCSSKGNLNFNYRLVYLPDSVVTYVVAHELCHLKELNHSKKFWYLVNQTIPCYEEIRKKLRFYIF